jgi:large subunit ribosomal protein L25
MASVKELKATSRPRAGKGAARAERRAGRVPGVIYGDSKPPLAISLDHADLRQRIYAGRFLTTIHEIEVEGQKHRVIPRDFQLDPLRDAPIHVDFMRLGEGATIRVSIPVHIVNAETSPGVKRGGTVNIVTHTILVRTPADRIPSAIDVDVSNLDLAHSLHLSDITLPEGVKAVAGRDQTLVTIVAPSGYIEEQKAAAAAAVAAAAAAAAAAEAAAAVPTGATGSSPGAASVAPASAAGGGDKK